MAPQREWFEKDYYAVLGVPQGATEKEHHARLPEAREGVPPRREPGQQGRPRSASRRSPPRTTCSATPRSARSTTRSATWSRRASGPAASAARRSAAASAAARRSSFDDDGDGGLGDLLGDLFGGAAAGGGAARGAGAVRSAVTTSRPSCTSTSTTRCTASPRTVRFTRRGDVLDVPRHRRRRPGTLPETCARSVGGTRRDRGRPGPVLVLAGVPDLRRARAGRHRPVPARARAAASRCAPREVKVRDPGRCRRRPAHPGQGPRRRRRATAARPATSTSSCTCGRTRSSGAAATTSRVHVPITFPEAALGAEVKVPTLDGRSP